MFNLCDEWHSGNFATTNYLKKPYSTFIYLKNYENKMGRWLPLPRLIFLQILRIGNWGRGIDNFPGMPNVQFFFFFLILWEEVTPEKYRQYLLRIGIPVTFFKNI